ncbi:MAG TPA: DsrH/TusB family sulfur metabolism protein [Pseudomonadota bacterium]|jgi:sulfur relay protein TusB/DsrH|nr:DsrH/TusB family sulfur metabolism protein [Pseudomonadota bacterium]
MSSRSDTLHCVVRAPRDGEALALVLSMLRPGDVLLLMQDGVRAALADDVCVPDGVDARVLMGDLLRRGLDPVRIRAFVPVDEAGFVALAARTTRQVCWA